MKKLRDLGVFTLAIAVALHLLAISLQAFPAPGGGMRKAAWKNPTVQGEFAAWTTRLNGLGVEVTQPELEEWLWTFAVEFMSVRGQVLAPFQPYYRYAGTGQSWRMFSAPHRHPSKLQISVRVDSEWRLVYESRSVEHDYLGTLLDHDRMRSIVFRYAWSSYRSSYKRFAKWVARRAARDFPEASDVRLEFVRYRTPSPEEVRSGDIPKGKTHSRQQFSLAALR